MTKPTREHKERARARMANLYPEGVPFHKRRGVYKQLLEEVMEDVVCKANRDAAFAETSRRAEARELSTWGKPQWELWGQEMAVEVQMSTGRFLLDRPGSKVYPVGVKFRVLQPHEEPIYHLVPVSLDSETFYHRWRVCRQALQDFPQVSSTYFTRFQTLSEAVPGIARALVAVETMGAEERTSLKAELKILRQREIELTHALGELCSQIYEAAEFLETPELVEAPPALLEFLVGEDRGVFQLHDQEALQLRERHELLRSMKNDPQGSSGSSTGEDEL